MEPLKDLLERAREVLAEGWRELRNRSGDALTHFAAQGSGKDEAPQEFPRWSLLAAETWETAHTVVVRVELPGMDRDDVTVDVHGRDLHIRGQKRADRAHQDGRRYHIMERAYGDFERVVPLPHAVDGDNAEVSCRDGVLTVIVPKLEPLPPR